MGHSQDRPSHSSSSQKEVRSINSTVLLTHCVTLGNESNLSVVHVDDRRQGVASHNFMSAKTLEILGEVWKNKVFLSLILSLILVARS